MLTPAFELSQDEIFLTVSIKAPYAKVSDADVYIDGSEFKFYAKPYFLRLNLPGTLIEDGRESAKYDCDKGLFTIKVPKEKKGEVFEGLDLLTKLLTPVQTTTTTKPTIEVLGEEVDEHNTLNEEDESEDFDWQIEQVPYSEPELSTEGPKYGFANQTSGVLKRLQSELPDLLDLKEADSTPWSERTHLREADEYAHFDEDHYMADFCEGEMIENILQFTPEWEKEARLVRSGKSAEDIVQFTDEEYDKLRHLPRREYVLDECTQQLCLLSLVDILFAFAYNHRITEGENTVESGWTICKLSSTLSWLQVHKNVKETVRSCFRRCLCYPLYRHWGLASTIFNDVKSIFIAGQKRILKCLLEIHNLLKDSDSRYVLNDLYITDYCVWMQTIRQKHMESLTQHLCELSISKCDIGFDLELIEQACLLTQEEEQTSQLSENIASLNINSSSSNAIHEHVRDSCNDTKTRSTSSDQCSEHSLNKGDSSDLVSEEVVQTKTGCIHSDVIEKDKCQKFGIDLASSTDSETESSEYESETESKCSTESDSDINVNKETNSDSVSCKQDDVCEEMGKNIDSNNVDTKSLNF